MPYTINEHIHRFSAWAASRAASVKGCRFDVETGKALIEAVGLHHFVNKPDQLPSPVQIDQFHEHWRHHMIREAAARRLSFTHGVAAKLINMYFKSALVCAGHHTNQKVMALHPPIDNVLLDSLIKNDVGELAKQWRSYKNIKWSKFNDRDYGTIIALIRSVINDSSGMWGIEQYWRGYQ